MPYPAITKFLIAGLTSGTTTGASLFRKRFDTPARPLYNSIKWRISLKAGVVMSALSLRSPDSVHRHINGGTYQQWAEVVQCGCT